MARQIRSREEGRWRGRPVASFLVRALTLLVPVGAGVVIAMAAGSALPAPTTTLGRAVWWALVLGSSTGAALLADRLARRLLPLAVLLKLTLVFPDRAPSRYVLARAAGNTRLLERRVREARERGLGSDPAHAAEMVLMLVAALSAHDRRTRGHSERVRAFVDLLEDELHMPSDARSRLRWAALLHDIGKLQVEAEVLNKREQLDDDEWKTIHAHPEAGARLAGPLLPWLGEWGRAIVDHHERFDGTGYPNGISGEEISVAGRITAIADSFETMTARPRVQEAHERGGREARAHALCGDPVRPGDGPGLPQHLDRAAHVADRSRHLDGTGPIREEAAVGGPGDGHRREVGRPRQDAGGPDGRGDERRGRARLGCPGPGRGPPGARCRRSGAARSAHHDGARRPRARSRRQRRG